jgi:hypothetical protein
VLLPAPALFRFVFVLLAARCLVATGMIGDMGQSVLRPGANCPAPSCHATDPALDQSRVIS